MLLGRHEELATLERLRQKNSASLVVVKGRRRIGKSSLVAEFGRSFKHFIQFQGLAPAAGISDQDQLLNVAKQFRDQTDGPLAQYRDWNEFFTHLAKSYEKKDCLILLDEISWMAAQNANFAGILKIAWDTQFKRNNRLVLVLCGSVSAWIEKNILNDTDFVGRISLTMRLGELDLKACSRFWGHREAYTSSFEKLKFLTVTGGVPKYLEELNPKDSVDANIKRMCFTQGGFLFEDFDRIFSDIFGRRSVKYRELLRQIVVKNLAPNELSKVLGMSQSGDLTEYLSDLEQSGFIARDYFAKPDGNYAKLSRVRISDNYLRFYLKYIEPNLARINKGLFRFQKLDDLVNWPSICGLQFENLVLNRTVEIIGRLNLDAERILFAGPHSQPKAARQQGCQIDLLIICRGNLYYICEIKFQKQILPSVVKEVQHKVSVFKVPKRSSVRSMLIYAGELHPAVAESDYFDRILDLSTLFD